MSASQGKSVRRSMSSQEIPCSAARSQAWREGGKEEGREGKEGGREGNERMSVSQERRVWRSMSS